jgi:hypothetical protein
MRFLLDENIPRATKRALEDLGHDVVSVRSLRLAGTRDPVIVDLCNEQSRLLITMDRGIHGAGLSTGIVRIRPPRRYESATIIDMLAWLLERAPEDMLAGRITILYPGDFTQEEMAPTT